MKGCKDGKGDGSNHRGGTGGGSGAIGVETGALFPRLHVKETKRVGPRAPPRNKMALYEQFTFPSHRFGPPPSVPLPTPGRSSGSTPYSPHVLPTGEKMALYEQFTFPSHRLAPPSGSLPSSGLPSGSSSTVLQSSSHDGSRYFCPPPYGHMSMPYMAMNVPHHVGQPFVNGSGSSTIVDGDSEMQRAQSIPATDSGGPSSREVGHASPRHSNANARSSASKKGRANDDCTVPIYTAPKASTGFPKVYTEGSDWFSRGPWQSGVDLTKAYQSMPVSYDYQVESSGPTSQRGECREDSVTGVTGEHRGTEVSAKIIYSERGVAQEIDLPEGLCGGAHKEKQISQIRSRYSQHTEFREYGADQPHRRKNKQYFDDTSEAEGVRSCETGNGECLTVIEDDEDLGLMHRKASSKAQTMNDSELTNSPHDHTQVVSQGLGKKQKRVESDGETCRKQYFSTECRSNTAGSSDDNVENSGDGEVSEHTQPTLWSDSEESDATMLKAASSHKITPKDLINAVGQQGFWTARKLLQRQQMIFSSQVFELHRLIKVQQLLAAPDYGGDEDDQAAPLSPDECPPEKGQAKKTTPEKQCSGHGGDDYEKNKRVTGQQPDSTCQSSTSKRVSVQPSNPDPQCGLDNAAPAPVLPSAANSGPSGAWGYPPFVKPGGSGWYGSMPAVNSPYMYQPYPGSFPQPAMHNMGAFNGSYRPVMCAPMPMDVSAMSPYGMPGYEARPDLMQDMYRYNTMQQQWQAAMYCNSVAQDPSASWYSVPPMPYMDPTQRMSSRWYEEMASSHPAAHPGFHRPTHQSSNPLLPTAQPMIYPMHPQWTEAALSQQQGREGERFRAQASWPMPGGSCQSSDQGFLRPVVSSAQESAASGSQVAEGGWGKTWQGSEGKSPQDSDGQPAEVPSAPQCSTGDAQESRSHKRSRENAAEGRSSGDPERQKSSVEENNPASGRRDALPLFPLVPVSNGGEKLKSSPSFPGVIKVVPRAMVATAESAAEILLSIQKQRQQ